MSPQKTVYAPPDGTLRIGATMALPSVLRDLGFDPAVVLAEVGVDLSLFANPDNLISVAARGRLIRHCVERTGCQHLGLLIGKGGGLHSLGLTGLLVKYSPDVGSALRSLVHHLHLHVRGAGTTLVVDGDLVSLGYEVHQPNVEATDQLGDGAAALLFNIMRSLCGAAWKPVEVQFAHRRPRDVAPYQQLFRATLAFDAEQNALVFPLSWMSLRLPDIDPELLRLLQQQVQVLESRHGDDFPEQVRSVMRTAIVTGHADAERVASLFSIHSRTLHRRLQTFGTGFQTLLDESRFEIARQLLADSRMDVSRIAMVLGYADASAFTRAFRRWSGVTPARWRSAQRPHVV